MRVFGIKVEVYRVTTFFPPSPSSPLLVICTINSQLFSRGNIGSRIVCSSWEHQDNDYGLSALKLLAVHVVSIVKEQ